ncbi:MAG: hypothetical protein ACI9GW_002194 [Halieaceae bacterium]|jgi:hypothetical protein
MSILHTDITRQFPGRGVASSYARKLLSDLGVNIENTYMPLDRHPADRWRESGLMSITGTEKGDPLLCPAPLASCADGALAAFRAVSDKTILSDLKGAELLSERAAIVGLGRAGSASPGGSCRLVQTKDGMIAFNLARGSDWEQLPAWLQHNAQYDWESVIHNVAKWSTRDLLEQGRLLGLAVADTIPTAQMDSSWLTLSCTGRKITNRAPTPRVLDLSSLWAGPLCSHLWQLAGADVIKIESSQRPDGTRQGPPPFFDLLNQNKQSLELDLHRPHGQRALLELIHEADIVLEGSRPRALRQMGIVAEELIEKIPGLTWVSISGYGRQEPQANWIAYGDDAGVAAGLSSIMHEVTGEWVICADAIADPLTGLHAALAGWANWQSGGGALLDLSLYQTVRHCLRETDTTNCNLNQRYKQWSQHLAKNSSTVKRPLSRVAVVSAPNLGNDNDRLLGGT